MKQKVLVLFLVLFGITSSSFAQNVLTLEEAIKIALQRNSSLIKSQNSISVNEAYVKNAYGALLPNLGLSGSWSWRKTKVDQGAVATAIIGDQLVYSAAETDTRNYNLYAGGNVTLFDGLANYAEIAQAENNLESSEFSLDKLKQDIVYTTALYYYGVISAAELVSVRQDNVNYNEKLLETIKERNKLGSIPIADVYTQQVSVGNAQLLLIQAQNNHESAKNELLNFLALDIFEEYELVDPYSDGNNQNAQEGFQKNGSMEEFVNTAFDNRKDFHSKMLDVETAKKGTTIAFAGMLPSLSGNYSYSTSASKPSSLFDTQNYSVGLTLSLPIFSNWSTEANMQYAEVNYQNEIEDLEALKRTIKIEVKESYLNYLAAKKQLEVTESNVVAAKENRRVNHERYNLGSGTILDVLQADKDYNQALTDHISAKFEYYQNRDKLKNSLGTLNFEQYQ